MKRLKKALSVMLALAMILTIAPQFALADTDAASQNYPEIAAETEQDAWQGDAEELTSTVYEGEEEYVTYIDPEGNATKLTTSLIESCDLTEKGNYLLSDVLTAAQVTSLGDCRYVMSDKEDYTTEGAYNAFLDADYFADMALFYNNGWRSTFDQNVAAYEGGWYKVKGLCTITAENHVYEDGACTNLIYTGRESGADCGEAEEVEEEFITYIDPEGNATKLTTSLIESCDLTEKGNYLLSDVLTAAQVTSLGDCRYVMSDKEDYTTEGAYNAFLDAEYFADMALFYNNGWRSTFDQNVAGYEGGWYKVKGLCTITAENHHYAEGVCDNLIYAAKETGEPCSAEEPLVEEYVTYIDPEGNATKLTTSLIESCDLTENGNYLLSDVLTAAQVTSLGDCRYVMSDKEDYTEEGAYNAFLDAEYFADMALFYNNGWRSTFDMNTAGYQGGWYKVKGLCTITAENHHYADGVCDNLIYSSRETGEPCGAEEPAEDLVVAFVTRLYNICLERDPDEAGLNNWVDQLKSGAITGIKAAQGFIFSQEFKNKNYCNRHFTQQLYRAFMGREPDDGGWADWIHRLESGKTREEVFNGFAHSNEFTLLCNDYGISRGNAIGVGKWGTVPTGPCQFEGCGEEDGVTAFVKRLYNIALNREAEEAGLNNWAGQLWAHTNTGKGVAKGFIFSAEFEARNLNNTEFVDCMYHTFFDRDADAAGKANWVGQLNRGTSRLNVFNGFANSQEFTNLCQKYGILAR